MRNEDQEESETDESDEDLDVQEKEVEGEQWANESEKKTKLLYIPRRKIDESFEIDRNFAGVPSTV